MTEGQFKAHVIDRLGDLTERVDTLADAVPTADQLQHAVARGMREALDDPDIWSAAMKGLSRAAQQEAGGWLFSGIKTTLSRLAWLIVLGLLVYQYGGWSKMVAFFKEGAA